jgi:hypothetical protein
MDFLRFGVVTYGQSRILYWQYTVLYLSYRADSAVSVTTGYFKVLLNIKAFKINGVGLVFLNLDMVEVPSSNLGSPTNLKAFKINDLHRF